MIICFALAFAQISAQLSMDKYGRPSLLTVRSGSSLYTAQPIWSTVGSPPLQARINVDGALLEAKGTCIVNSITGDKADAGSLYRKFYPGPFDDYVTRPIPGSFGAIPLKHSALWLFGTQDFDVSMDPVGDYLAVEITTRPGGVPHILRAVALTGLGPYAGSGIRATVHGNRLALVEYGISVLELSSWSEVKADAKWAEVILSSSGNIYRADGGLIFKFDFQRNAWLNIGGADLGGLTGALLLDGKDVLVFEHGLWRPDNQANYRFPGSGSGPQICLFLVPSVGIGFVGDLPPDTPGALLSGRDLRPLAIIRRSLNP